MLLGEEVYGEQGAGAEAARRLSERRGSDNPFAGLRRGSRSGLAGQ